MLMKKLFQQKGETILGLSFATSFFISFMGGCSAKLIYQVNGNQPDWLNSVVVAMSIGVFFCSVGFIGLLASRKTIMQSKSLASIIKASLLFLFYFVVPMALGLLVLRNSMQNFINLF